MGESNGSIPFPALTPAQRLHLEINGYVVIENAIGDEQVKEQLDTTQAIEQRYRSTGELPGPSCHVSAARENYTELLAYVTGLLIYMFRFVSFTHARWMTVGKACRFLLRSLLVGLDGGVDDWLADYIRGFKRLNSSRRNFIAVAGLASSVSDSVLALIFKDDRLAMQVVSPNLF